MNYNFLLASLRELNKVEKPVRIRLTVEMFLLFTQSMQLTTPINLFPKTPNTDSLTAT